MTSSTSMSSATRLPLGPNPPPPRHLPTCITLLALSVAGESILVYSSSLSISLLAFRRAPFGRFEEEVKLSGAFTDLGFSGRYSGGYTVTKAGHYEVSVTQAQPGHLEAVYFDMPDLQYVACRVCCMI